LAGALSFPAPDQGLGAFALTTLGVQRFRILSDWTEFKRTADLTVREWLANELPGH
jgi:hypothetical protein